LVTVLVGEDPASQIYVSKKGSTCHALGMAHEDFKLSSNISEGELLLLLDRLNADDSVDGILVQSPLPKQISSQRVYDHIRPDKDVDCFSATNVGLCAQNRALLLPCTPAGIMELLRFYKIAVAGKNALVLGRSDIVGKPMALLLLHADATVTVAHSKTSDLAEHIANSDLVVSAIGRRGVLTGTLPWKSSCTVIDVGIHRIADGRVVGDCEFSEIEQKVAAITPVPGGVGPMTIAWLMANTVKAAYFRKGN
ncbi:MAG TPA: bifunctional 5,10-methylenetetrahydrofolate dehydrogenase/5,10-methenyltetrahydrofolate cyclohydrolase, partial [Oligoflexia bacterium]|nr:bifunctional 5,10-methylenetetrahydrofolate dehydrogenase/5,10-methenyltetrahydrofolate cyclohydrolase [Oligoflexia bacterium]